MRSPPCSARREVDIAVDLNAHIANARPAAFAMRPAPIQVSYLVYPGTIRVRGSSII